MADATTFTNDTQVLLPFKGVKKVSIEEYFTSGHRTCQGCESALVMKLMVKASGPRTIVLGSTGCMYVANTTYYTTPWVVPWMHTQLGSSGSAALGTAAGLKALMKKGKMKSEPINVIAFCGDGGGADMGLGAISATLMRQILVDHARRQRADKRGGGVTIVSLDDVSPATQPASVDVLALDQALEALSALDARQCRVVELRFFAGLNVDETADALEISPATVERDWALAKAWLYRRLSPRE